jgi:hypothetical protein
MADAKALRTTRLILIPTVITLAVTLLRVVGELKHWPAMFFSTEPGGHLAIVGISWLPIIFGPYFALKLAGAGEGPSSNGKAIGYAVGSLVVLIAGGALFAMTLKHTNFLTLLGLVLMFWAAFVPGMGWKPLGTTLVAYAFAARVPTVIVYYYAIMGNGGAGLGTHYDRVPPNFPHMAPMQKFIFAGLLPQMTLWIGFTAVIGAIFGTIVVAIAHRGKEAVPASS